MLRYDVALFALFWFRVCYFKKISADFFISALDAFTWLVAQVTWWHLNISGVFVYTRNILLAKYLLISSKLGRLFWVILSRSTRYVYIFLWIGPTVVDLSEMGQFSLFYSIHFLPIELTFFLPISRGPVCRLDFEMRFFNWWKFLFLVFVKTANRIFGLPTFFKKFNWTKRKAKRTSISLQTWREHFLKVLLRW